MTDGPLLRLAPLPATDSAGSKRVGAGASSTSLAWSPLPAPPALGFATASRGSSWVSPDVPDGWGHPALGPMASLRCRIGVGAGALEPDRRGGPRVRLPAPSPDKRVASEHDARRAPYPRAPGHASTADGAVPGEQYTTALPSRLGKSRAAPLYWSRQPSPSNPSPELPRKWRRGNLTFFLGCIVRGGLWGVSKEHLQG